MTYHIAVLAGDGIGPEGVDGAIKVMEKIGKKYNHNFLFKKLAAGGMAIDLCGNPMPDETIEECLKSDSVLLGAFGGPKWDNLSGDKRPEKGLLKIRSAMGLYANLRPAKLFKSLNAACPLKSEIANKGVDLIVVRELTGGIYFGEKRLFQTENGETALDTEIYSEKEIIRVARRAFELAQKRRKKVTSIDKANILESSRLWRRTVNKIAEDYKDVYLENMLVDNAAMQLVKDPSQFDVILTSNMFGDILSDEAAMLTGSIGMLASSSLGDGLNGLYEPIHGSAPSIAGKDEANPIATILSCAMMLKNSFSLCREADDIDNAVFKVLEKGYRTADIYSEGFTLVKGSEMTDLIIKEL